MDKWYETKDASSIVISNRIRLARNLKGYKFPSKMSVDEADELISKIREIISKMEKYNFECIELKDLETLEKEDLIEHHAMSPEMLTQKLPAMIILNKDQTISIMVNEEDHLRIQGIGKGEDITSTWEMINEIDDKIEKNISYAFDQQYGYMSACPTNVGTGLRASYMLHLPVLNKTKYLKELLVSSGKIGMSVRGMYGEGTKPVGDIYQISNQKTLGRSEIEIIDEVKDIAMHIIKREQNFRDVITKVQKEKLKDTLYRSYGILVYARSLNLEETMDLLSDIKLGFELGIYDMERPEKDIYEIMLSIQESTISKLAKDNKIELSNDVTRANIIRKHLNAN